MMPPLVSLAIFDGVPPQEEGQDPTVFSYLSSRATTRDSQFNEVGLYLTFMGFCNFNASEDCQYIKTDKLLTALARLSGTTFAAASFDVANCATKSPRVLMASMSVFATLYRMLPGADVAELLRVFRIPPFVSRLVASLDAWTLCEGVFADARQHVGNFLGGLFYRHDCLFHCSIPLMTAAAIVLAIRARVGFFAAVPLEPERIGRVALPPLELPDGAAFPLVVAHMGLIVVLLFTSAVTAVDAKLGNLKALLDCTAHRAKKPEAVVRCEGASVIARNPAEFPEKAVGFLREQDVGFVRAAFEGGTGWTLLEEDGDLATVAKVGEVKGLADAVAAFVTQVATEKAVRHTTC
jgi:hypothetical protein